MEEPQNKIEAEQIHKLIRAEIIKNNNKNNPWYLKRFWKRNLFTWLNLAVFIFSMVNILFILKSPDAKVLFGFIGGYSLALFLIEGYIFELTILCDTAIYYNKYALGLLDRTIKATNGEEISEDVFYIDEGKDKKKK